MSQLVVFPGQGSQAVGMGQSLNDAYRASREVFSEVNDALGQNLSGLMFDGPQDELTLTENAQPALMAVSVATIRAMKTEVGFDLARDAAFVAGHSLGEYSALCAAGAISLSDTAKLLKQRGQAMQAAVPVGQGAMAALLGLEFDVAKSVAEDASESQICATANDNAPGQVVVSGDKAAVERAVELAKERGARRPMLLPVSAPFHCPLMQPAAEVMADVLTATEIGSPIVPLIANVTAETVSDGNEIRNLLVQQVTSMVRWRESILYAKALGVDTLIEVGAGRVLATMTKRIDKDIAAISIGDADGILAFGAKGQQT